MRFVAHDPIQIHRLINYCFELSTIAKKQGAHMFEKLKSLSFPWNCQGIFKFFPEQL